MSKKQKREDIVQRHSKEDQDDISIVTLDSKVEMQGEPKRKVKKIKDEYQKVDKVVQTFQHYYNLGNRRKREYFKNRKSDKTKIFYGEIKKSSVVTTTNVFQTTELRQAELEKGTIDHLKEMYFDKPMTLKEMEEVLPQDLDTKKQDLHGDDIELFSSYLNKYEERNVGESVMKTRKTYIENEEEMEKSLKDRAEQHILSVYKMDEDNLFTNHELKKIKMLKEAVYKFRRVERKREVKHPTEVWQWNEFLDYFVHYPVEEDKSSISESSEGSESTEKEMTSLTVREEYVSRCLTKWFNRESPPSVNHNKEPKFQFHERKFPRIYEFDTNEKKKDATLKFIKWAKLINPEFDGKKVITKLDVDVDLDALKGMGGELDDNKDQYLKRGLKMKKLRFFDKLLEDSKDLAEIYKEHTKIVREDVTDIVDPETVVTDLEEKERGMLSELTNNNMTALEQKYCACSLPPDYKLLFISTVKGLLRESEKIYKHPKLGTFRSEIKALIENTLFILLHSMEWLVEKVFRGEELPALSESSEEADSDKNEEDMSPSPSTDDLQHLKKLMATIIKCMNFKLLLGKKHPDVSSSETQLQSGSTSEEKIEDKMKKANELIRGEWRNKQ